jgi:predicted lipoprotein with Yx(FWY)xxD motif
MNKLLSTPLLVLGTALAAAFVGASSQAGTASHGRAATRPLISIGRTALGPVLVNGRGQTLYLFEKDHDGVSACNTTCLRYWPALTTRGTPRAGTGVRQSLLRLGSARNGARQVLYAGHPLYRFAGDKRAGQTTGENLNEFGAEWYALSASGAKVEPAKSASSSGGAGYGGW